MESSLSAGTAGKDVLVAEDDGGGTISEAAGLAKEAAILFQSCRYVECVDTLRQLLQKKQDDPKVIHNIAVVEYFRDGCSDPRKLLDVFYEVKRRSEELACSSGEQVEFTSNAGSGAMSGTKGTNSATHQLSTANNTIYAGEYDTSVVKLNMAIILFNLHEYARALSILEPLYQNIEPVDVTTAFHICLLLLDVALASHNASKAAEVIQYLEKAFCGGYTNNHGDIVPSTQTQSALVAKTSSSPSNLPLSDVSNHDIGSNANSSDNQLTRTLSDETIDYEDLLSSLDISRANMARPSSLPSHTDQPAIDLQVKLHLYKVRLLLLARNLKATKRKVKLVMTIARGRDSSMALLLKSQLEHARGNYSKAIKLLMTSNNRTEAGMSSIVNNNLGCVYHELRKHHTSTLFFSQALKNCSLLRSERLLKLSNFSQDKSHLIVYNCGLEYLVSGKPVVAARCFQKASLVFHSQPVLWVRLAECCLLALEMGLLRSSGMSTEVALSVVGSGKWRQVVVEDSTSRNRYTSPSVQESALIFGEDSQEQLSMSYARQCLLNALYLLNICEMKSTLSSAPTEEKLGQNGGSINGLKDENTPARDAKGLTSSALSSGHASMNGDLKENKEALSFNVILQSSVSAYEEIRRKENLVIKQAVLADLAYVELYLENPSKALSAARALLQLPECCKMYVYLGHVYAAEALCRLNRLKEAAEELSVYITGEIGVELPYTEEDHERWQIEKIGRVGDGEESNAAGGYRKNVPSNDEFPQGIVISKPEESRGILYVNLAALSAVQGDTEQARLFITRALSVIPNNPIAVLGAAYVDLLLAKSQDALDKLKQCSRVRVHRRGVTTH